MIALPNRYEAITAPFGVVGAIVVEASPRLDDNQWILDVAADEPVIVGLVGRLDPADQAFGTHLDRLHQNPLFLGIRQGRLHLGLDNPDYIANLKLLADADCSLDVDTPRQGMTATEGPRQRARQGAVPATRWTTCRTCGSPIGQRKTRT